MTFIKKSDGVRSGDRESYSNFFYHSSIMLGFMKFFLVPKICTADVFLNLLFSFVNIEISKFSHANVIFLFFFLWKFQCQNVIIYNQRAI
jgi:hypothetical protein